MTVPWDVLVVSSDLEQRRELAAILRREDVDPICASSIAECQPILARNGVGLIFCDGDLAGGNYRDLLFVWRAMKSKARIVVALKDAGWDQYLEAMRLGAFDVIASPYHPTDVEWMVIQAKRDERIRLRRAPGVEFGHSNAGSNSAVQA